MADPQHVGVGSQSPGTTIRIMTANVHKGFNIFNRRFILPELRAAVTTVGADLVFLQEVLGAHKRHALRQPEWPGISQYEYLADTMWPQFAYGRNAVYPDGDHGNALLSKFPILWHQNLDISVHGTEERGLLHCILDVPGHNDIHAICVHLGLREVHRAEQLKLLGDLLDSLPVAEKVIIAGDFNDWRGRATAILARYGIHEAFIRQFGMAARSFPARWPMLRLDRVYVKNADTRNPTVLFRKPWSHLSDHAPLVVEVVL